MLTLRFKAISSEVLSSVIAVEARFLSGRPAKCNAFVCRNGSLSERSVNDEFAKSTGLAVSFSGKTSRVAARCVAALEDELKARIDRGFLELETGTMVEPGNEWDTAQQADDHPTTSRRTLQILLGGVVRAKIEHLVDFSYVKIDIAMRSGGQGIFVGAYGHKAPTDPQVWFLKQRLDIASEIVVDLTA